MEHANRKEVYFTTYSQVRASSSACKRSTVVATSGKLVQLPSFIEPDKKKWRAGFFSLCHYGVGYGRTRLRRLLWFDFVVFVVMENSWHIKCGASVPQSSQEHQHQILSRNLYLQSSAGANSTSLVHRLAPETVNHWSSNLSPNNMTVTEKNLSFLSLLSGTPRTCPDEVLLGGSHVSGSAAGSEVSLLSSQPFGPRFSGQRTEAFSDLAWFVSSTTGVVTNQGSNFGPKLLVQGCPRDLQQLDVPQADTHSNSINQTRTNLSYLRMGCLDSATSLDLGKIHVGKTVAVSQRVPDSSVSCSSSSLLTGVPRVFCLGLSGILLISNPGHLGVVCSCHGWHMSLSKFAQHSGSCNVNPGIAIHVDGGETIANWRKAYFHKSGIRVPEDYTGWDWPQESSAATGLLQPDLTRPNFPADSPLYNQANDSLGACLHSLSQLNHILPTLKNTRTDKKVDEFVHRDEQKSCWEDSNSIKFHGSGSSTKNGLHFVADDQIVGYTRSVSSMMPPNVLGVRNPYNVLPVISSCKDSVFGSGNSLHSDMPKLLSLGKDVSVGRIVESSYEDTTSSNIELKLGQPSQQNRATASGSSVTAVPASNLVFHSQPRGSVFMDQHLHQTSTSRSIDRSGEYHLAGTMTSSIVRTEKNKMKDLNHVYGAFGVSNSSQLKVFNKNAASNNAVTSESSPSLRSSEEKHRFKLSMDSQSGPSLSNADRFGFPFLNETIRDQFSINLLDSQKRQKDDLWCTAEPNRGTHTKPVAEMLSFGGVDCHWDLCHNPVLRDKVSSMCQNTSTMANAHDMRNNLKHSGQVSYPVQIGQHNPISSRTSASGPAHSLWNSAKKPTSAKSFADLTGNGVGDGRSRIFPFQSISALSSDIVGTAGSFKTIPDQRESQDYCEKIQFTIPQLPLSTRKNDLNLTDILSAAAIATPSCVTTNVAIEESEKLPSVTDDHCDFQASAASQRCYSIGKDAEPQFRFHTDPEQTTQWFMRVGCDTNLASSSKGEKCYTELMSRYFPQKFDCLPGRPDLLRNPSLGEFEDKEANAVGLVAPLLGPKLSGTLPFSDMSNSFAATKKAKFSTFEWRDVPRKVVKYTDEADTKCSEKSAHHVLKELEISNLSSGCSAPAVSQASIKANNKDSFTVNGAVTANNLVVDEGSRIERCDSTDDDDSGRSAAFSDFPSKSNLMDKRSSKAIFSKFYHDLKGDTLSGGSLKLRKMQSQTASSSPVQTRDVFQNVEDESRSGERSQMKAKQADPLVPAFALHATQSEVLNCETKVKQPKNLAILSQGDQQSFTGCPYSVAQNSTRVSKLSSSGAVSWKRDLNDQICAEASEETPKKRLRLVGGTDYLEQEKHSTCTVSELASKGAVVDCNVTSGDLANVSCKRRPIACGKYGVLCNANSQKPAKIVSLSTVLKAARRCSFAESGKLGLGDAKESNKKANLKANKAVQNGLTSMNEKSLFPCRKNSGDPSHTMKNRRNDGKRSQAIFNNNMNTHRRRKFKHVRKRSINELSVKGSDSNCEPAVLKCGKSVQSINGSFSQMSADEPAKKSNIERSRDLGESCCVCGSSNEDDCNCLLECDHCLIKVHQACYGVSVAPKARWYCRPCKTNSRNTVCVLCGYGGGAMTRALRTHNTVKSLLKAWGIMTETDYINLGISEPVGNSYKILPSTKMVGGSDPFLIMRPAMMESNLLASGSNDLSKHGDAVDIPSSASNATVLCNSIVAGVFDASVKQWVHMVCGLWTPGTRCPNVGTMSSFDVSGTRHPKPNGVCSICQRSGGTCIQCRVADCHIQFHPWCAHQKGLLQSEVEGADNESVGFYGRCMVHEIHHHQGDDSDNYHNSNANHGEREPTCARTEGYKGRKQDISYDNHYHKSDTGSGCLVSQEQLNAWIHIHGQKSSTRGGPLKAPTSAIEPDCRKEYARYKQLRGWKHLVVYKSGIHGHGLYTSQFISRGAMVVEYVGEIVGVHVADKRETEYQAGKKLQYKSACYFFKIDKEHIIDATRKGGIARFVNHSCSPNCVAKVISVRNEKKVVFFAERDIYPGEEVTYDYHFNHEDDGKKLPCFCKSKNCRLYLN
ncbi:OLC1v1027960C1 [Oldenlandia corymbosa var. corymbosa]|uniref:OLC1v1027960C1 n=1 Tax=Oldenlandia corymbosa var. corymbosa TaxID=529605 RepID=A0AAV1CAL6_OLDCO|nr:OLC1v1027960C1 [Oldenlandia corymbosa var. corymbosa]